VEFFRDKLIVLFYLLANACVKGVYSGIGVRRMEKTDWIYAGMIYSGSVLRRLIYTF